MIIPEAASLLGAAGGIVARVEVDDHGFPTVIAQ